VAGDVAGTAGSHNGSSRSGGPAADLAASLGAAAPGAASGGSGAAGAAAALLSAAGVEMSGQLGSARGRVLPPPHLAYPVTRVLLPRQPGEQLYVAGMQRLCDAAVLGRYGCNAQLCVWVWKQVACLKVGCPVAVGAECALKALGRLSSRLHQGNRIMLHMGVRGRCCPSQDAVILRALIAGGGVNRLVLRSALAVVRWCSREPV